MSNKPTTRPLYTNEESREVFEVENQNSPIDENDSVYIDLVLDAASNGLSSNQLRQVKLGCPAIPRDGNNSSDNSGTRRRLFWISEHKDITQAPKRFRGKEIFCVVKMNSSAIVSLLCEEVHLKRFKFYPKKEVNVVPISKLNHSSTILTPKTEPTTHTPQYDIKTRIAQ